MLEKGESARCMVTLTFPNCDQNERLLQDRPQLPAGMLLLLLLGVHQLFPLFGRQQAYFCLLFPMNSPCNGLCALSRKIV